MKINLQKDVVRHLVEILDEHYVNLHRMGIADEPEVHDLIGIMKELIVGNKTRDKDDMFEVSDEFISWLISIVDSLIGRVEKPKGKLSPETAKALKERFDKDIELATKLAQPLAKVIK